VISALHTPRLELVPLDPVAIRHLIAGDRSAAEGVVGRPLPEEFPDRDDLAGFLPVQLKRMEESPDQREWMARLMVDQTGTVIGHCGFHGPPRMIGRAEIGYTVFPPFRRQGFAREAARALADWAFEQGETEVYASVSPSNAPSLAVVRNLGFREVGVQEDEVDGTELVFALTRA